MPKAYPDLLPGGRGRGGPQGTHNSLQKLWKGQEAVGQAGHFRWLWLPDLEQVKVKHQLHAHLPNSPIRQRGRGPWVGHRRTDTVSEGRKARLTLHPAHSYHVSQGAPAHLTIGYWQHTEDETVRYHHGLNGREPEQTLGGGEGREAWRAAVHGAAKSGTQLSNWTTATKHTEEAEDVSQRLRFRSGRSPRWTGLLQRRGAGQEEVLPLKQGLSLHAFQS